MAEKRNRSRTSKRTSDRWATILDAAEQLFLDKGYADTSVQDIADQTGLLKGSLYYYIDTKEDLLFAILEDVHEQGRDAVREVSKLNSGALVKVRALIASHVRQVAHNRTKYVIYAHDFRALSGDRLQALLGERDTYERAFRELVRAAQTEGSVCPDVEPRTATSAILGMINSIHLWFRPSDEATTRAFAEDIADLAIASIYCAPGAHVEGHRRRVAQWPASEVELA